VLYLAYLAWSMWKESGTLDFEQNSNAGGYRHIAFRAFLINILSPKLSIFFLAFLPQFVPAGSASAVSLMLGMSGLFMLMTLIVFIGYGLLANQVRSYAIKSPKAIQGIQRLFSGLFVALGVKLAVMER
jgi:threonine/homoserine/homoserine lactone efflux protein